eukprot:TRINITY_DN13641_c0_g1_i1.p1 TRINITY_DN13641_c0_g1~~TRINITY_DN13641_c0_g1_i1.p1  ORF type:complete len:201 (-),score=-21.91 TRINITY_DN13641_c0_g1_i1:201-803(-)
MELMQHQHTLQKSETYKQIYRPKTIKIVHVQIYQNVQQKYTDKKLTICTQIFRVNLYCNTSTINIQYIPTAQISHLKILCMQEHIKITCIFVFYSQQKCICLVLSKLTDYICQIPIQFQTKQNIQAFGQISNLFLITILSVQMSPQVIPNLLHQINKFQNSFKYSPSKSIQKPVSLGISQVICFQGCLNHRNRGILNEKS